MGTSRGVALVGLVLAVAAGVLVASLTVSTNAAVINGTAISQATLNGDLSTISRSPAYQCVLLAEQSATTGLPLGDGVTVSGAGVGSGSLPTPSQAISIPDPATYSSGFTAFWLDQLISQTLLEQYIAHHGLTVDGYAMARARANLDVQIDQSIGTVQRDESSGVRAPLECPTTAEALYKTLPGEFVDHMVRRLAADYVFTLALAGERLTPAAVAAYYRAHRSDFDTVCLAVLPVANATEAQQVSAAVAAGTSFPALAEQNGGQVGCAPPAVSSVAQVAAGLPVGQLSSPIQTSGSQYLLVQRVSSATQPLDKAQNEVVQAMVTAAGSSGGKQVANLQRDSHVWVDPRYGHWVAAPFYSVETWRGPTQNDLLCPAANYVVSPDTARCPATPETGAVTLNTPRSAPKTGGATKG